LDSTWIFCTPTACSGNATAHVSVEEALHTSRKHITITK